MCIPKSSTIRCHVRALTLAPLGRSVGKILLPCSHSTATGNHRVYQTAKSWFWGCVMYRNSSFSTLLILNHTSHGAFSSLFSKVASFASLYRTWLPSCSRIVWRLGTIIHICLKETRRTSMKCLPQPWLLSRLCLTIAPSGINDFRLFLRLPRAIGSIS